MLVLMPFRSNDHFGQAFPIVYFISIVKKSDIPGIGARPQRQHRKGIAEIVESLVQVKVRSPCPHQLAFIVEESTTMMTIPNGPSNFDGKSDCRRIEFSEYVGIPTGWFHNSPAYEAAFSA